MMCFLNTEISEIAANNRLSLNRTPSGRVFALGNDFRVGMGYAPSMDESRNLGIPRPLLSADIVIN